MYGLCLDHCQRLVVILHCYMSTIMYVLNFSRPKPDREAMSLYIHILDLNISKCFTGKGYGLVVLEESSTEAIFTGISLQDKELCMVIISLNCPEKHIANPGLQVVKGLICGGVLVPICYLLPEEGGFRCIFWGWKVLQSFTFEGSGLIPCTVNIAP